MRNYAKYSTVSPLTKLYNNRIELGLLHDDPHQRNILKHFSHLQSCGKTLIMDLFYESCSFPKKSRVHYHVFMRDLHTKLHEAKLLHHDDHIPSITKSMINSYQLLCMDEFQVTNIADAMILTRLFTELFKLPFVLVTTSNRSPDQLYLNGLQRKSFLPCIALLKKHCHVHSLASSQDYRLGGLLKESYLYPLRKDNRDKFFNIFEKITLNETPQERSFTVFGRQWMIPCTTKETVMFTFNEICGQPYSANEYIELAKHFKYFFLSDIPRLTPYLRDETRRFIHLLDSLYENKVKLICLAECSLDTLFDLIPSFENEAESTDSHLLIESHTHHSVKTTDASSVAAGHEEIFAFKRALSRLHEMHSDAWWQH